MKSKPKEKYIENKDLERLVEEVVSQRKELSGFKIKTFLYDGKTKWAGKTIRCSDLTKKLSGVDIVILVNKDFWETQAEIRKKALIEHELCHILVKDGKVKLLGHDIEEFITVASKYGAWHGLLDMFRRALERGTKDQNEQLKERLRNESNKSI